MGQKFYKNRKEISVFLFLICYFYWAKIIIFMYVDPNRFIIYMVAVKEKMQIKMYSL